MHSSDILRVVTTPQGSSNLDAMHGHHRRAPVPHHPYRNVEPVAPLSDLDVIILLVEDPHGTDVAFERQVLVLSFYSCQILTAHCDVACGNNGRS